ncbi:hypothetical protein TCA2_3601 [Paenibacillus sp. TCA20]|uniref:hypothetical protein n=1 Tax=Paenibacillus sp. TCA20 TaxID=1499968 RepID=UPI0004DAB820|nr:hypothetical protein [Paenibacillus sp. TCA20]GAK41110.1 hypothetical protein TCA2_3601 [Paenibacillus sp. TCA20]
MGIVELYIISIYIYLGVYTAVDVVKNGVTPDFNVNFLFKTFSYILLSVLLLYLFSQTSIFKNYKLFKLENLIEKIKEITLKQSIFLLSGISLITLYTYFRYGLLGRGDVAFLEESLPYYLSSIRYIIPTASFMLCVISYIKFTTTSNYKFIWIVVGLISFSIAFLYGRRIMFTIILVLVILYIIQSKRLTSRVIFSLLILSFSTILLSNVFQNYRYLIYDFHSTNEEKPALRDALLNFETTTDNLSERTAMWKLNYLVAQNQNHSFYNDYGLLLLEGTKNAIPSVIWEGKKVSDLDSILATNLLIPVTDFPSNILAFTNYDFRMNGIFIFVLFILLILYCAYLILYYSQKYSFSYTLIFCNCLINFMNIENTYTSFYTMLRDNLIILIVTITIVTLFSRQSQSPKHSYKGRYV